jgi:hypothetical protein
MKITVSQLRRIIREEVVRSLRLTEAPQQKVVSADDFNEALEKYDPNIEYRATEDVTVEMGDGGFTLKTGGDRISGTDKELSPEVTREIVSLLGLTSRGPKQYGSPGMGGG